MKVIQSLKKTIDLINKVICSKFVKRGKREQRSPNQNQTRSIGIFFFSFRKKKLSFTIIVQRKTIVFSILIRGQRKHNEIRKPSTRSFVGFFSIQC